MDCCNYVDYRGVGGHYHQMYNDGYPPHGYQSPSTASHPYDHHQSAPCFRPEEASSYHTDYVYNPKEARLRKAIREQSREARNQMMRCQGGAMMPSNIRQPGPWGPPARQAQQRQGLISPRILAEQQRNLEETKKVLRDQVEHSLVTTYGSHAYLDLESMPYHQLNSHMNVGGGEDYVLPDMEGQDWLQYAQTSQPNNSYMMRPNEEVKLEPWSTQFPSEAQMQQAYNMKQQIMNGATHHYANNMPHQQMNMASTGNQQMMNRQIGPHNNTTRLQEQNFMFEHPPVNNMANQAQNVEIKKREEPIQMLELMSAAASSNITTPTTSVTPSKMKETQSDTSGQQTLQSKSIKSSPSSKSQTSTSMVPNSSENSKGSNETESNNCPLPAFETAFGSTEIGRYSHEGFFNTNQQLEMQQAANTQVSTNNSATAVTAAAAAAAAAATATAADYNYYMGSSNHIPPPVDSSLQYHPNQLSAINQYSGVCNYYNYNEFHQHFSYSHNQFAQLNPWTSAPMKYENVINY